MGPHYFQDFLFLRINVKLINAQCGKGKADISFFFNKIDIDIPEDSIYFLCDATSTVFVDNYFDNLSRGGHQIDRQCLSAPSGMKCGPIEQGRPMRIDSLGLYLIEIIGRPSFGARDFITGEEPDCFDVDTLLIFKSKLSPLSAGSDILSCRDTIFLNGTPPTVIAGAIIPIVSTWKQIDQLPAVTFEDPEARDTRVWNLSKDKDHRIRIFL